ncbi:MAG TPA: NAD-dependent epimerase/dehydratase family protein [Opitutaceae bacterium]|nr:NAD-dependent epimerase/dehydratase family protein [Opitutaceae bacterium]
MSTYLVTGAAGFIASKVCEQLLAAGHTVVGIDNLNDYYDVRLKDWRLGHLLDRSGAPLGKNPKTSAFAQKGARLTNDSKRFVFLPVDIEDRPALERLFEEFRFDAVFNLAARAGVRASMDNPYVFLSTNTEGTINILECQRKFGVKKLVLASTSSLYAGSPMPWREDLPVNTPLSPYAATKKAAELLAHSYHLLYQLDVTIVRYFTVFGPAGRPDMSIFRFIKWIDEEQPLELFGDGSQARDFTYVDDIAAGTILAAKPLGYEIINLGGGRNPISLQTVIAFIEKALGKKAKIAGKPFHIADIKESWADIAKADRLLGWKPQVGLDDGFSRCVRWYRENRAWLKDVKL